MIIATITKKRTWYWIQYVRYDESDNVVHQYTSDDDGPDEETHGYVGYNDEGIDKTCVDAQYFISL